MKTSTGQLRHRVTLEYPNPTQVEGTQVPVWATVLASIPAEILAVAGGETVRGKQIEAGIDTVVIVRFGLSKNANHEWSDHRFVHDSRNLNIVRAADEEGTREFLTCYCKELA
jgi:head-tail adaptor